MNTVDESTQDQPTIERLMKAQRSGLMEIEIDTALREVAEEVMRLGKKGTVTVTLALSPVANHHSNVIEVIDTVTAKPPIEANAGSLWFGDHDGSLHRNDPLRQPLPLDREDNKQ